MNGDDERDYAEEADVRAEVEREGLAEQAEEFVGVLGGRYKIVGGPIGIFDDSPCDAPTGTASMLDGRCRCVVCGRCGHHTGNGHQGHYWAFCKVTGTTRAFHFCCPDDCELEAAKPASVA